MVEALLPLRITSRERVANDVVALELSTAEEAELPPWTPGAHVDLHLPLDTGTVIRQYSLCGRPEERTTYRIGVLLAPRSRGGSAHIHSRLGKGDTVLVSPPRNRFELVPARRYVFVAGGVGITPILPMVHAVAARGLDWALHYAGRSRGSMAFVPELPENGSVTLAPGDEGSRLDLPETLSQTSPGTAVYCCGPESLIASAEKATGGALHVERFANDEEVVRSDDEPFQVELALSGKTITVRPGVSVLDAVREAGVEVYSSCREGTCGTCETFVLAGQVDHRDSILTPQEKEESEVMMICVSRCRGGTLRLEL